MKKLLFIINPKAGRTAIKGDLFEIIMTFAGHDYDVSIYPTKGPNDAARKVREDGAKYDMIVCAGGDGTLRDTVCGYMDMGEQKISIGYIPVGTTNDFARSLGISRKPVEAAAQIVNGAEQFVDVGRFEDKHFVYIAAFGIFTDISYSTKQSLKRVLGHSAYVVEALKNIANFKSYKLEAQFDDALITGEYIYGMITNSFSVAGFKIRGTKHVVLDDGKFDCFFIKKPQNPAELQQILSAVLTNGDIEGNEMFFQIKAAKIHIISETPIEWTLDGEFGGETGEVTIINEKQAVGIYHDAGYAKGITESESSDESAITDLEQSDDMYDEDYYDGWE